MLESPEAVEKSEVQTRNQAAEYELPEQCTDRASQGQSGQSGRPQNPCPSQRGAFACIWSPYHQLCTSICIFTPASPPLRGKYHPPHSAPIGVTGMIRFGLHCSFDANQGVDCNRTGELTRSITMIELLTGFLRNPRCNQMSPMQAEASATASKSAPNLETTALLSARARRCAVLSTQASCSNPKPARLHTCITVGPRSKEPGHLIAESSSPRKGWHTSLHTSVWYHRCWEFRISACTGVDRCIHRIFRTVGTEVGCCRPQRADVAVRSQSFGV